MKVRVTHYLTDPDRRKLRRAARSTGKADRVEVEAWLRETIAAKLATLPADELDQVLQGNPVKREDGTTLAGQELCDVEYALLIALEALRAMTDPPQRVIAKCVAAMAILDGEIARQE